MRNVTLARWNQLDSLVEEALAHPPDERSAILRATCGHDVDLYRESVALLERLVEAEQALGESVAEYAAPLWDSEEDKSDQSYEPGLAAGTEVGAYRVLRELGRGGYGCGVSRSTC